MFTLVSSILCNATETWTLTITDRTRLEAFEMWIWRRTKISWMDKISNEEVLAQVSEMRTTEWAKLKYPSSNFTNMTLSQFSR